jgi:hypothetical protein
VSAALADGLGSRSPIDGSTLKAGAVELGCLPRLDL